MPSTAQTTTLVTEGAIPSQITELQLQLVGGEAEQAQPARDVRIATVPLSESRGLPLEPRQVRNPPNWPNHRGVPDYVPFEQDIDRADRPLGQNGGEFGFLIFMLSGVQIVSAANHLWRGTIGRFTDETFKYKIGGQW